MLLITSVGEILSSNKAARGSDLDPFSSRNVIELVTNRIDSGRGAFDEQLFCGEKVVGCNRIVVSVEQNGFAPLLLFNPCLLGGSMCEFPKCSGN